MRQIDLLFRALAERGGSDLHLSPGQRPLIRLHGKLEPLDPQAQAIPAPEVWELLRPIVPDTNRAQFEAENDTDFAYELSGLARFRCNLFRDRRGVGGVFRIIPQKILSAEQLNLAPSILDLCWLNKGLVLVTGPTGSGKSTTLCAMIDYINRHRHDHIITIEDPIEFVHENKSCLINQREVGPHTGSFKRALRAALREDPDIVLVGEMRDLETMAIAMETAETGHLVFGTLHTSTAASTVDRIIDQFPSDQQNQVRTMLAESLKGVISQTLVRTKDGKGRRAALEVLLATQAVSSNIREGKTHQIPLAMQTGRNVGMVDLNTALLDLVQQDVVSAEEAWSKAVDKNGILRELERLRIPFTPPAVTRRAPAEAAAPASAPAPTKAATGAAPRPGRPAGAPPGRPAPRPGPGPGPGAGRPGPGPGPGAPSAGGEKKRGWFS